MPPLSAENRVKNPTPPGDDLGKFAASADYEQDGGADGQSEFKTDDHMRNFKHVSGEGIHFPKSNAAPGKQGTGKIVRV